MDTQKKKALQLNGKTILVTGCPGFIGAALVERLLKTMTTGTLVAMDNMNGYYDVNLKRERLDKVKKLAEETNVYFDFVEGDIGDKRAVDGIFEKYSPDIVVNLAAQAGVRYSIDHPDDYIKSNILGFYNILEACRHSYDGGRKGVEHLVYASSSSVYGANRKVPFSTDDNVDNPVSLYAATKKSNELFAHSYSKLYGIPTTGLRFFTVYGPMGRPDMFYFTASEKLRKGETISLFNYGDMKRDFTYIDDIVDGIVAVMKGAPEVMKDADGLFIPPYAVYNIGGGTPENLEVFVDTLIEKLMKYGVLDESFDAGRQIKKIPMQQGDVKITFADAGPLERDYGVKPTVSIQDGLDKFAEWYAGYVN